MRAGPRAGEEDSALVAAARAGDPTALTEIWQRFAPRVSGYLRGRGVTDPDDLTSEVFIAVFERIRRFHGNDSDLRAFVFTVAHHRLVDDIRRRGRRQPEVEYHAESDERMVASAEDEALAVMRAADVQQLLDLLPADQREVLLLRVIGDLSIETTATVMGKSVGAVKAMQHRALNALRRNLSGAVSP
jgi:RNA polymerase sigma-70 factor (ECF subfamily)